MRMISRKIPQSYQPLDDIRVCLMICTFFLYNFYAISFLIKFQREQEGCKSLCFVPIKILAAYVIMQSITGSLVYLGKLNFNDTI
jgi:hypothetical protein